MPLVIPHLMVKGHDLGGAQWEEGTLAPLLTKLTVRAATNKAVRTCHTAGGMATADSGF